MCMIDYGEPYRVHLAKTRTARKEHKCGECYRTIEPGESYEYVSGLEVDRFARWHHHRTCAHCVAAREWLMEQCNGWVYEGVYEDLREHWDEDWALRSMELGRSLVGMRRRWRRKDGTMMPVAA